MNRSVSRATKKPVFLRSNSICGRLRATCPASDVVASENLVLQLSRQESKPEYLEIRGIGGEDLARAGCPENGRKLRVEDAFAAELMALHPVEEQPGGIIGGKNVLDFGGVPPKTGLGHSLVRR